MDRVFRVFVAAAGAWCADAALAQSCSDPEWIETARRPWGALAMAYDAGRGVLVGFSAGRTWESSDALTWQERRVPSPEPGEYRMVYDAARGVCVLVNVRENVETWTWDGDAWTLVRAGTISPRYGFALAYDASIARTVLFGGELHINSVFVGETWTWDGNAWELLKAAGPPARRDASMSYDSARARLVLYGGYEPGYVYRTDTWEFDGASWSQVHLASPAGETFAPAMAFDPVHARTVVWTTTGVTFSWDGAAWTPIEPAGPAGFRFGPGIAWYPPLGRIVMSGGNGFTGTSDADRFWSLSDMGWVASGAADSLPRARFESAAAFDEKRELSVLFGGYTENGPSGETWLWDGARWSQAPVTGPDGRVGHAMTYDSLHTHVLLFGGEDRGDTWAWDGNQWTVLAQSGPSPRRGAAMAYDAARGVAVLFGGFTHVGLSAETWEWDGATWNLRTLPGPGPRFGAAMTYDPERRRTVLFGGFAAIPGPPYETNDTWEYDGVSWTQVLPDGPSPLPRFDARMVFDHERHRAFLCGGLQGEGPGGIGDAWEWDGAAWVRVVAPTFVPRGGMALAYDGARHQTLLFGGGTGGAVGGVPGDTWLRVAPTHNGRPWIETQPGDRGVAAGDNATFGVVAHGPGPLTYQWRRNGVPLSPFAGDYSGARTPNLTILGAAASDEAVYDVVITNACGDTPSKGARLRITSCPADFNRDALVNSQDFFDYLTAFFTLDPRADFDASGAVDSADFFAFLGAWMGGCP
jgi:hypothetical protein